MSRLDEIRARVEAATPGPWRRSVGPDWLKVFSEYPARRHHILLGHNADDLNFAAHAREDIPYLLDLVERAVPFARIVAYRDSERPLPPMVEAAHRWLKEVADDD